MPKSPSTNLASKILLALVDDSTPFRTHNAISIYSAALLGICTVAITFAAIFTEKNLAYELATLVTALAGLAGYQYGKGLSAPTITPPPQNPPTKTPSDSSNSNSTQIEKKEGETEGDG